MVNSCFVKTCKNRGKIPGVSYHRFPKNNHKTWLAVLNRSPGKYSLTNVVCSDHFVESDFIQCDTLKKLKPQAIPSLYLKNPKCKRKIEFKICTQTQKSTAEISPATSTDSSPEYKKRNARVCCPSLLLAPKSSNEITFSQPISTINKPHTVQLGLSYPSTSGIQQAKHITSTASTSSSDSMGLKGSPKNRRRLVRSIHNYSKSPRKQERMYTQQKSDLKFIRKKLSIQKQKEKRLKQRIYHLMDVTRELKKYNLMSDNALIHLEKSFSGIPLAVMKRMLIQNRQQKNCVQKYPPDLRSFAMTLQFYSPKAYEYVRSKFQFCLPAQSVIRSWTTSINCLPGFTELSFDCLKSKVKESQMPVICNLVMDEMAVKKHLEYQQGKAWGYVDLGTDVTDDSVECATEALVLMVVALNANWKMPVAYFLIKSLTGEERANIVLETLKRLDEVGVKVISLTCDGPSVNFKMLQSLGCVLNDLNNLKTYFLHPNKKHNVFVLLDVCHMIKLIRNNWATLVAFKDPDGNRVDFTYIKNLHSLQEKEGLKAANKISKKHMNWQTQKMKVNIAAQTLSRSVATAIEWLNVDVKDNNFTESEATVKFILLVDTVFDILNSRNPYAKYYKAPLKPANEHIWRPKLIEAMEYFEKCTDVKGIPLIQTKKKTPFIGSIISIKSVIGIYDNYVNIEQPELKYLLTYKTSQDHLELYFCSIRAKNGWNNNPTCYQFCHTYKRLLLQHELKNIGNVTSQDATNLLFVLGENKATSTPSAVPSSETDILIIKKYGLEISEETFIDHDYCVPIKIGLTEFTSNVVSYISGYLIKMVQKRIKCTVCIEALSVKSNQATDDMCLKFIERKDYKKNCLVRPSYDVRAICEKTEIAIRKTLSVSDGKLPTETSYSQILINSITNEFLRKPIFLSLEEHLYDTAAYEEPHIKKLIQTIVFCYTKIRMHSIAKTYTEKIVGEKIRKKLTKIILFSHQ